MAFDGPEAEQGDAGRDDRDLKGGPDIVGEYVGSQSVKADALDFRAIIFQN